MRTFDTEAATGQVEGAVVVLLLQVNFFLFCVHLLSDLF